eukprot:5992065-Pleurochrysis_carterae.AAC.1
MQRYRLIHDKYVTPPSPWTSGPLETYITPHLLRQLSIMKLHSYPGYIPRAKGTCETKAPYGARTVHICHADFRPLFLGSVRFAASSGFTDTSQTQECVEYVLCHLLRQRIQNAYQVHLMGPPTIEYLRGMRGLSFGALVRVTLDLHLIVHFYTQAAFVYDCVGMAALVCIDLNQDHCERLGHDLTHVHHHTAHIQ